MNVGRFYVYVICRVDIEYFQDINEDLKKHGYEHIRAIVPSIEILKHVKGGKRVYEHIPLLFNYGFVKMFNSLAHDRVKLDEIRRTIPGIHSWVKSTQTLHPKRHIKRTDNKLDFDDFSQVAMVTKAEVERLNTIAKQKYTHTNLPDIEIGDMVTLRCYPYEGMDAVILDLNLLAQTARVELFPGNVSLMIIDVPIDTVLYSIYQNHDDSITSKESGISLENIPDVIDEVL